MVKRLTLKMVLFLLALFAVTFGTASAAAEEITINNASDFNNWNPAGDEIITLTSDGDGELLAQVLNKAENGSTIILANGTYSAGQFLIIGKENIKITNATGIVPELRLTGATDGFKIQSSDNITVENMVLNGTKTANYGFRVQSSNSITFGNITATNMLKTAFDISRNTNSSYTNITAENNGGYGITITQGENVTITGVTENNSWGGLNVNNKQQGDGNDINTTDVKIFGVTSEETKPIVLEQYVSTEPGTTIADSITPPEGTDLAAGSIIISNDGGIGDGAITTKFILLNPNNTAAENGAILANVITSSVEGNEIEMPDGTYNIGNITVPVSIVLEGDHVGIVGTITRAANTTLQITGDINIEAAPLKTNAGSGSGTGSAVIIDAPRTNNTTNNTNNNNTLTGNNSNTNNSANGSNGGEEDTLSSTGLNRMRMNIIIAAAFVVMIGGTVYYFTTKNKN